MAAFTLEIPSRFRHGVYSLGLLGCHVLIDDDSWDVKFSPHPVFRLIDIDLATSAPDRQLFEVRYAMKNTTSWADMLRACCERHGDDFSTLKMTLTPDQFTKEFYAGFGGTKGAPFTAWSEKRVYFPICYDGAEWVGSAPRNPCDEALEHQGG